MHKLSNLKLCQFVKRGIHSIPDLNRSWDSRDKLGSAHPVSHIRMVKFGKGAEETIKERELRKTKEQVQEFVHQFWLQNNTRYQQRKLEFEEQAIKLKGKVDNEDLTRFYLSFLNESKTSHAQFHREYVLKSFKLVLMSYNAKSDRVYHWIRGTNPSFFFASKANHS